MRTKHALAALVLPLATACGGGPEREAGTAAEPSASAPEAGRPRMEAPADPLEALRANQATIAARAELAVERVRVAHILVAFEGAMRSTIKGRTREQAEQRAAELLDRIQKGEDFETLMRASSDDPGEGIYTMVLQTREPGAFPRKDMAPAFGNVGWRLDVGEVGVAPHDPQASPFGWHIIKRVE